jgi:predicted ribosome quality control (RQC) complex YloA/Tae2 family protein
MFSFLDIYFIKKELDVIIGSRFEKIFKGKNFVLLQFSKDKKYFVKYVFGKAIFLSDKEKNKEFFIEKDDKLKIIEKTLERAFLKDILIFPGERIIKFIFDKFGEKLTLTFVLFGKGEIVLENKEKISYFNEGYEIKKHIELKNLEKIFQKEELKEKKVEEFLKNFLGFGKYYFNEFKTFFNFDYSKKLGELSHSEIILLKNKIIEFLNQPLNPVMTEKRPFPIYMKTLEIVKKLNSFSEGLEEFFKEEDFFEKKKKEILKSIEKNKKVVENLEKEKKEIEEKINLIYNYYGFFEELLFYYQKAKEEKKLNEFFEKLEKIGIKIDKKNKCLKINKEILEKLT